ncbi:MAG TPA: tRNA 2-thiouridine(34) synthase MnmA [Prolixibacteraceae bacterium]|jgi:tRNA-specific 2-thiouridylase|nr:tRNA 2-thiouridine(34) synthase MnmA [Prolixibacteraceae bacterium]
MGKGKVLLCMSGGIDSSVAAMLLNDEGYQLHGLTYRPYDVISPACMEKQTGCCSVDAIFEAKALCNDLKIDHTVLDLRNEFDKTVISDFVKEYLAGRTPNPCVLCNSVIKWGEVIHKADELGCEFIATGHYARIGNENGRHFLIKGEDLSKDQTYFLWQLSQEDLKRTLFPLGHLTKTEVREIAARKGYEKISKKRESQEICFIPDNDYRRFIKERVPNLEEKVGKGNFVDLDGKVLGQHYGYPFYTIGQRKGLEIALGKPRFVIKIDAETNTVTLGDREDLDRKELWVEQINLMKYDKIEGELEVTTKIRYNNQGTLSRISQHGTRIKVEFYENTWAVTPGQSAVFYEGNHVVGGGIISSSQ